MPGLPCEGSGFSQPTYKMVRTWPGALFVDKTLASRKPLRLVHWGERVGAGLLRDGIRVSAIGNTKPVPRNIRVNIRSAADYASTLTGQRALRPWLLFRGAT